MYILIFTYNADRYVLSAKQFYTILFKIVTVFCFLML